MTSMRAADRGNFGRVTRCCEPIVNCSADAAAFDRRFACTMVPGDQQNQAIPARDCLVDAAIDRGPSSVEIHAVQIDDTVGRNRAGAQLLVPAGVERLLGDRNGLCRPRRSFRTRLRICGSRRRREFNRFSCSWTSGFFPGQRPDRRGDARPQPCLFRAERAHVPQRPSAPGPGLRPKPTFRLRSRSLRDLRPRRYRSGSAP